MGRNPFNENMSYQEAREALAFELGNATAGNSFLRLQGDYGDVLPVIIRREISAAWEDATDKTGRRKA